MPFAENLDELKAQGYEFQNDSRCKCGALIEWWKNTRTGKFMPMDVDLRGNCEAHWVSCPNAKDFRKAK